MVSEPNLDEYIGKHARSPLNNRQPKSVKTKSNANFDKVSTRYSECSIVNKASRPITGYGRVKNLKDLSKGKSISGIERPLKFAVTKKKIKRNSRLTSPDLEMVTFSSHENYKDQNQTATNSIYSPKASNRNNFSPTDGVYVLKMKIG